MHVGILKLDHIVVAGVTLDDASQAVESALGVSLQQGGRHSRFGTHNRLLGLAGGIYLEVIAIDPAAPAPSCSRWFDLDSFTGLARPVNWVCRTKRLETVLSAFPLAGEAVALARGDLNWLMAVPRDGRLPLDNLFPGVIEWQSRCHPSMRLENRGVRLRWLIVGHSRAKELQATLSPYFLDSRVVFETSVDGLRMEVDTPRGLKVFP